MAYNCDENMKVLVLGIGGRPRAEIIFCSKSESVSGKERTPAFIFEGESFGLSGVQWYPLGSSGYPWYF